MGLFDKLFKRKRTEKEPKQPKSYSNDIVSKAIFDINSKLLDLMDGKIHCKARKMLKKSLEKLSG